LSAIILIQEFLDGLINFSFIGAKPGTPAIEKFPEYSTFSSGV
jgi:hypothetical protein